MTRTGNDGSAAAGDRQASLPPPLKVADLRKQKRGSPRALLYEVLFWGQWGSVPKVLDQYDRAVLDATGVSSVTGAFSFVRGELMQSKMKVIVERRQGPLVFIGIELDNPRRERRTARESFLLRRTAGGWRVVFDTLLERSLTEYFQFKTTRDPTASRPDGRAVRAGVAAAQRYRDAYVSLTRR